ncbi:hypothetical protein NQ315_000997 [Exocentrus adspersus]|uniref:Uncharacterized protein n=1 Tax=Exocentrus adspersus TaxID=1586481 RepID=A0AAV8WE37_9CUCU|nr:hypothetical protein NQ315_000997 [Exocentrus adspersus]
MLKIILVTFLLLKSAYSSPIVIQESSSGEIAPPAVAEVPRGSENVNSVPVNLIEFAARSAYGSEYVELGPYNPGLLGM